LTGKQAFNATLQGYGNVVRPDNGPDWQLRFQVQLLFPKQVSVIPDPRRWLALPRVRIIPLCLGSTR
jgi:hypothetical protein